MSYRNHYIRNALQRYYFFAESLIKTKKYKHSKTNNRKLTMARPLDGLQYRIKMIFAKSLEQCEGRVYALLLSDKKAGTKWNLSHRHW